MEKTFARIGAMADYVFSIQSKHVTITVAPGSYTVYGSDFAHEFQEGNQAFFAEIGVNRMGNDIHEVFHLGELTPSQKRILDKIEDELLFWGEVRYIKKK